MTSPFPAPPASVCGSIGTLTLVNNLNQGPASFITDLDTQLQALSELSVISMELARQTSNRSGQDSFRFSLLYQEVPAQGANLRAMYFSGDTAADVDAAVQTFFGTTAPDTAFPVRLFDLSPIYDGQLGGPRVCVIYQEVGASDLVYAGVRPEDQRVFLASVDAGPVTAYDDATLTLRNADGTRTETIAGVQNRTGFSLSAGDEVLAYRDPTGCNWLAYGPPV